MEEDVLVSGWLSNPNQEHVIQFTYVFLCLNSFYLPTGIARRLKHLQRDFLWDEIGGEPKFHRVNWRIVCSSVPRGALSVKNLMLFKKVLLGKWLWSFAQEDNFLWRRVIVEKYEI